MTEDIYQPGEELEGVDREVRALGLEVTDIGGPALELDPGSGFPSGNRPRSAVLTPDDLEELRQVLDDPRPQDLEGIAWAARFLLEERDARAELVLAASRYGKGEEDAHDRLEAQFVATVLAISNQPLPESSGANRRASAQRIRTLETVNSALALLVVARKR